MRLRSALRIDLNKRSDRVERQRHPLALHGVGLVDQVGAEFANGARVTEPLARGSHARIRTR